MTAPNQGEVERLAGLLQEYRCRIVSARARRQQGSATVYSESSYLAGDLRTPVIVQAAIASRRAGARSGSKASRRGSSSSSARRILRTRPMSRRGRCAREVEDGGVHLGLSRSRRRRLRGARGSRHRALHGPAGDRGARAAAAGADDSRVRRRGEAVCSAHAARSDSEVSLDRDRSRAAC